MGDRAGAQAQADRPALRALGGEGRSHAEWRASFRCATAASCAAYGGREAELGRSSGGSGVAQRPCGEHLGVDCKSTFWRKWLAPRGGAHAEGTPSKCCSSCCRRSRLRTPRAQHSGNSGDSRWSPSCRAPSKCSGLTVGAQVWASRCLVFLDTFFSWRFLPWISLHCSSCVGAVVRNRWLSTAGARVHPSWYTGGSIRDGGASCRRCLRVSVLIVCVLASRDFAGGLQRSGGWFRE
eukprot:COSAG02_NODE_181_length_30783_cov_53.060520_18_plen_237_part_00